MREERRRRLERRGWRIGSASEFLGLTDEEAAYVDLKLRLARGLRKRRRRHGLTQAGLARRVASSQARVARMEAGDPSVSLDRIIRALLALGLSSRELARLVGTSRTMRERWQAAEPRRRRSGARPGPAGRRRRGGRKGPPKS